MLKIVSYELEKLGVFKTPTIQFWVENERIANIY